MQDGFVIVAPNRADLRLTMTIHGLRVLVRTGGRMRLNTAYTPSNLKRIASEYTGKSYARSQKGTAAALADLEQLKGGC